MKKLIKKIIRLSLSPIIFFDYLKFKKNERRFSIRFFDFFPCIKDKTIKTNFDAHYVYHTAWAIRKVKEINPEKHIDISSSLFFSSALSAFIETDFYDLRPVRLNLSNLSSNAGNLLSLPFADASIKSLSCMHTIEHVGLGRYGDKIDPDGDLKAIKELIRVLATGGSLIFVVPIGKPKIEFNAHRIYSYDQIMDYFKELTLVEFSLIPDSVTETGMYYNSSKEESDKQDYGCGCFVFKK